MSEIGHGYGSEWHLLRYLGYHRQALNQAIAKLTGGHVVEWLDMQFNPKQKFLDLDSEWKGLDFLPLDLSVKRLWQDYWPQTGNIPNWDAVGWLMKDTSIDLLLVEAKGHLGEIKSNCQAKENGGLSIIKAAFDETKESLEVEMDKNWLAPYYQYCNRLATLHFLLKNGISARLLFIYFLNDKKPQANCPKVESDWKKELDKMKKQIGLTGNSPLESRIYELYLSVCPT